MPFADLGTGDLEISRFEVAVVCPGMGALVTSIIRVVMSIVNATQVSFIIDINSRTDISPCHRRCSNHAAKGVIADTSLKYPWRPWIECGNKEVDHDPDLRRGGSIWRANQMYAAQIRRAGVECDPLQFASPDCVGNDELGFVEDPETGDGNCDESVAVIGPHGSLYSNALVPVLAEPPFFGS
jgi:hypothetical protein